MINFDIKWRGKKLGKDEWLVGSLYDDGGELYILPSYPGSALDYENYQINPNTLGIWIGRDDKYGRPIYTGDFLQDERGKIWRVEMSKDQVQIMVVDENGTEKISLGFRFENCNIIGTVWD